MPGKKMNVALGEVWLPCAACRSRGDADKGTSHQVSLIGFDDFARMEILYACNACGWAWSRAIPITGDFPQHDADIYDFVQEMEAKYRDDAPCGAENPLPAKETDYFPFAQKMGG
jgi:hypothetical protein